MLASQLLSCFALPVQERPGLRQALGIAQAAGASELVQAEDLSRKLARLLGQRLVPKWTDELALGGRRPEAQLTPPSAMRRYRPGRCPT